MLEKIKKFWYFNMNNPIIRKGEAGAFKYIFRRFTLDLETLSGNFRAHFTAAQNPYGYLLSDKGESNIHGYAETLYEVAMLLTTDQGFVDDIQKALKKYSARLGKVAAKEAKKEDETEEKAAIEWEKQVQEYVELPRSVRRRREKGGEK